MSTNLEYRERERQKNWEKVGEAQREKGQQRAIASIEREIKSKGDIFLLEEQHENFAAAVRKREMLAATKAKMSGIEKKVNKNTYDISSIKRVTRPEVSGSFT